MFLNLRQAGNCVLKLLNTYASSEQIFSLDKNFIFLLLFYGSAFLRVTIDFLNHPLILNIP